MSLTPRVTTYGRLRRVQYDELRKVLQPFADAADRIETALGVREFDNRLVRSGARLTLGDLRRARHALRGIELMLERERMVGR
jgi:hypothetical protein